MTNKNNPNESKKTEESIFDFIMRVGDKAMAKAIKELRKNLKINKRTKKIFRN